MKTILLLIVLFFASFPAQAQWIDGTVPYNDYAFLSLATMGNNLIAVCGGEVFRSTDLGNTWLDANNGIEYTSDVEMLFTYGSGIFVGTAFNAAILYSNDTGQTWQARHNGFISEGGGPFVQLGGDTIIASAGTSGVYRSIDTGLMWNPIDTMPPYLASRQYARCFAASNGYVFAGTFENGIFRSSDAGNTWENIFSALPSDDPVLCLAAMGSCIEFTELVLGIS